MEEKINIAEILKDKTKGTKLHDLLYNVDVELDTISTTDTETVVWCTNETDNNTTCHRGYSEFGTVRGGLDGLQILLPSKDMRDWRKFAWKRGDILLSKDNAVYIIFEKFEDDTYTRFKGKHYLKEECDEEDYNKEKAKMLTSVFEKTNDYEAQTYIKIIEERLGGKLNRETLEIEKQPEFKDGDIVTITFNWGEDIVYIFKSEDSNSYSYYAWLNGSIPTIIESSHPKSDIYTVRLSTEQEKQQLFDALAKEGKAWDAEKKQIVDLKPKVELKPFDKVLVRDGKNEIWEPAFFFRNLSHLNVYNYQTVGGESRVYCIPFNEKTAKLIGTTDDWEG
jgi:hypothetical protein